MLKAENCEIMCITRATFTRTTQRRKYRRMQHTEVGIRVSYGERTKIVRIISITRTTSTDPR